MGVPQLKALNRTKDGVQLIYRTSENQQKTDTYTHEEFNRMLAHMNRLKLKEGDTVIDDENIEKRFDTAELLEEFRGDIIGEMEKRLEFVRKDRDRLLRLYEDANGKKDSALNSYQKQFESQIRKLMDLMDMVRAAEDDAFTKILSKEELFHEVVKDLEKKQKISWDSLQNTEKEVDNSLRKMEHFQDTIDRKMMGFEKSFEQVLKDIQNIKKDVMKDVDKFVEAGESKIDEILKMHELSLEEQRKKIAQEEEVKLKQEYIDREIARRVQLEEKKKELVRKKTQKLISKIKRKAEESNIDAGKDSAELESLIKKFQGILQGKPNLLSEEIAGLEADVQKWKDKIDKARKEKIEMQNSVINEVETKVKSDSLWDSIINKIQNK